MSDDSNYKRRRRDKKKKYRKHKKYDPIKLCTKLTAKLLTTSYKSKIQKIKLDEDPLQHRIYFLNLIVSLKIIFMVQGTWEVVIDYPIMGGENITDCVKTAIRNIINANIDFHSRR